MKKVTLLATFLCLFLSISLRAQDANKITFMLLLNEAKQNFKTILGEEFQKSEDGKKTFYSCNDGFHTTTEFITVEDIDGKLNYQYVLYFELAELSSEDLVAVSKIVEDGVDFANMLLFTGEYEGGDFNDEAAGVSKTQVWIPSTEKVVMEISTVKQQEQAMVIISFNGHGEG
jgi:hypothetical protein